MEALFRQLLRSRSRAMVAIEYMAIAVVLIPVVIAAFNLIGRGLVVYTQTKIQNELTFSNLPDQDLSGPVVGGGSQSPP